MKLPVEGVDVDTMARAIRDELLRREQERQHGTAILVQYYEGDVPPTIEAPASMQHRPRVRLCLPRSAHLPPVALGLYQVTVGGLLRLDAPTRAA